MQFPIQIGLHRSRIMGRLLFLLSLLIACFIWILPFSQSARCLLSIALVVSSLYATRLLRPISPHIRLLADGRVLLVDEGEEVEVDVMPPVSVHPWLCVVSLKAADTRVVRLLFAVDSSSTADFRRFRVWLRYRAKLTESDVAA